MFWDTAFKCAYDALGVDNILFAVDYPYDFNEPAAQFIKSVEIPDQDREKICHLNAEKWLHL
jgi:predicted TIM-barrel fold metal-dependent hydrolase